jgi:hypothetical protein
MSWTVVVGFGRIRDTQPRGAIHATSDKKNPNPTGEPTGSVGVKSESARPLERLAHMWLAPNYPAVVAKAAAGLTAESHRMVPETAL